MFGAPLNVDDLAIIFGFRNRRGVNRAIRMGIFPIPTFMQNNKRFGHPDHVNEWLVMKKAEAETDYSEWDR